MLVLEKIIGFVPVLVVKAIFMLIEPLTVAEPMLIKLGFEETLVAVKL